LEDEAPFRAKEFEKRYRSALLIGPSEYLPVLIGMDDAQNMVAGFQSKPKPFLIGNIEQCKLIRKGVPLLELKGAA
ncbi:TPA: DUF6475 domain-containing protein, partial [Yersinia enterocolitica]